MSRRHPIFKPEVEEKKRLNHEKMLENKRKARERKAQKAAPLSLEEVELRFRSQMKGW